VSSGPCRPPLCRSCVTCTEQQSMQSVCERSSLTKELFAKWPSGARACQRHTQWRFALETDKNLNRLSIQPLHSCMGVTIKSVLTYALSPKRARPGKEIQVGVLQEEQNKSSMLGRSLVNIMMTSSTPSFHYTSGRARYPGDADPRRSPLFSICCALTPSPS